MYVVMNEIQTMNIIENPEPMNFGKISYDLRVEKIIVDPKGLNKEEKDNFILAPGGTVFVATIEDINMPLDMIGIVTQRNSIIRNGLSIDAPIYHPGHHTKIFLRVTNISDDDINIQYSQGIASIMFAKLSEEVDPYKGKFTNEFDYIGVGDFSKNIPQSIKVNKKIDSIENMEKTLYEKVIALLTVFVGIFSLINLNVNFLANSKSLMTMLIYNMISIGGIGIMVGFVSFIVNKKSKVSWIILIISLLLIAASIFLVCYKCQM